MDEVHELCRRVLGSGVLADEAAAQAHAAGRRSRITKLAAATEACRALAVRAAGEQASVLDSDGGGAPGTLTAAVARELSQASARLPELDREALALRELLRLSYREIARAMQIKPATVAPLLANARLRLRAERRGPLPEPSSSCEERERALGLLARRQDSEPVTTANQEWLLAHMAQCPDCEVAHAAMLEASVCYRAWR
jgi:DNA-binding CsgD family transcriptional regulator